MRVRNSVRPKPKFRPKFRSTWPKYFGRIFRSTCRNTEMAKNVILTKFSPIFCQFSANFWRIFQNFSLKWFLFWQKQIKGIIRLSQFIWLPSPNWKEKKNWKKPLHFHVIFGRISAEISVSAETDFGRFGRSLVQS